MQNRQTSDVLCFDRARLHQSLIPLYQFNLKGVRGPSVSIHNMLIRENNLSTLTPDYQCKSKNDKVEIKLIQIYLKGKSKNIKNA